MSATIAIPDTQILERKSLNLSGQLDRFHIARFDMATVDALRESLEQSAIIGRVADDLEREVERSQRPVVKDLHDLHAKALAELTRLKAPATEMKRKAGLLGHACNAELLRRQAEAEALAQQERDRLQREADEAARIGREAAQRDQDDALMKLVEAPPEVPLIRPAPVFVPPAPVIYTKVEGAPTFGADWDFVVENEALVPREYLMLDEVKIRRVVKAMKGTTRIPGIKAVEKPRTTFRRAG